MSKLKWWKYISHCTGDLYLPSSQPHHVAVWKSPGHWSARLLPFRPFFPITDDFPHSSSNLLIVPDGVTFYITIFHSISSGLVRSHTVLFRQYFSLYWHSLLSLLLIMSTPTAMTVEMKGAVWTECERSQLKKAAERKCVLEEEKLHRETREVPCWRIYKEFEGGFPERLGALQKREGRALKIKKRTE